MRLGSVIEIVRNHLTQFFPLWRKVITFHLMVDVTTLLASVATVYTLLLLLHDRRDLTEIAREQADTAAWQLLQNYLQHDPRVEFELGQTYALTALAKNGITLAHLDAKNSTILNANLRGADLSFASFQNSKLNGVTLADANMWQAVFDKAILFDCYCERTAFRDANLFKATLRGGNYKDADFEGADISDLKLELVVFLDPGKKFDPALIEKQPGIEISPDAFRDACYQMGHEPDLFKSQKPRDPQGSDCERIWGKEWTERGKGGEHKLSTP